jgi:uncharacterized repeat protein (TIGR03803 family)
MKGRSILRFASALAFAGALYASAACAASETLLYSFKGGVDGAHPDASLIKVNGVLYGTTILGGGGANCSNGCGTVFSVTPGGSEQVLYAFQFGTDGAGPQARLISVKGTLYGTTISGGKHGDGTVFSVTPSGGEQVLYAFKAGNDGVAPAAGLINVNGTLYGTTREGGDTACFAGGCGTVFSVTTSGIETVLHAFSGGSDGATPFAELINVNGTLYGTTISGGSTGCGGYGCGTLFSITPGGTEQVLHAFKGGRRDGCEPVAGLINVNGTLYGTTKSGGIAGCGGKGCGTVFSITPGGTEQVLYAFKGGRSDGCEPVAGLINVNGTLYGTTEYGGAFVRGTVFSVTPKGAENVLYSFEGGKTDGAHPQAGLVSIKGTLYGTTDTAGASRVGTVFSITP